VTINEQKLAAFAHAVLLDTARLVDQPLEDSAYRVGVERLGSLTAEAFEHLSFALGIVRGEVVLTLEFANGEHDLHAVCDELQDAAIQFVDTLP